MSRPVLVVAVQGLPDALRAAAAAAALGARLELLSAPGAVAFAGCGWFAALARATAAAFPDLPLSWTPDCGDRAGDALEALNDGCPAVIFTGDAAAAARLADIAAQRGARLLRRRPDALVLRPGGDPLAACRSYLTAAGQIG